MSYFYSIKQHEKSNQNLGSPSSFESDISTNTLIPSGGSSNTSEEWNRRFSIPWAEDAIQQNQSEWERIERIFYGEEELPDDKKTRDEFREWIRVFPHFRVIGKPVKIHENPREATIQQSDPDYEEVFAIDPPPPTTGRKSSRRNTTRNPTEKNPQRNLDLSNELETYLKITPSPVLRHKIVETHSSIPLERYFVKIPSTSGLHLLDIPKSAAAAAPITTSLSASHIRMPPIYSIKLLPSPVLDDTVTVEDRRSRKPKVVGQLQSRVTLPAIDLSSLQKLNKERVIDRDEHFFGRQINEYRGRSAVNEKRIDGVEQEKYPRSATKIKIIEFH